MTIERSPTNKISPELNIARTPRIGALLCAMTWSFVSSAAPSAAGVEVGDAWIRWLPANLPGAGYMTLSNTGSRDRVLTTVSSTEYADISMHRTGSRDGVTEMVPVASVTVAPHASIRFAPGGYHLMLMGPKRRLNSGDRVEVTLRFADGATVTAPFEVRGPR